MQGKGFQWCCHCWLHCRLFNQHAGGVRVCNVAGTKEGIENFVRTLHLLGRLGTQIPSLLLVCNGFAQVFQVIEVTCSTPFSEVIQCKLDKLVDFIDRLEFMDAFLQLSEGITSEFLKVLPPEITQVAALTCKIQANIGNYRRRILAHKIIVFLDGVTEKLSVFMYLH